MITTLNSPRSWKKMITDLFQSILILKSDVSIGNKILLFLLLLVNNCVKIIVSNFKDKANHFTENFNTQCNLTTNNRSLPSSLIYKINLGLSSISSPN